jgi:hypothetical protein
VDAINKVFNGPALSIHQKTYSLFISAGGSGFFPDKETSLSIAQMGQENLRCSATE